MSGKHRERERQRRIQLASVAVVAAAAGTAGLAMRSCNPPPSPPQETTGIALQPEPEADPMMERHVAAYVLRLDMEMREMNDAEKVENLLREVRWAVGMRARGVMNPDEGDLYFDFVPRISAVRRVANRTFSRPEYQRKFVESLNRTCKMLESAPDDSKAAEQMVAIFTDGFDTLEEAKDALLKYAAADPEFHHKLQDEITSGYNDACQRLVLKEEAVRGRD